MANNTNGRKKKAPTEISRCIQQIVDEAGITKKEFAHSVGVHPNHIYQLMSGDRTVISESLAKLIEMVYDYPPGWMPRGHEMERPEKEQRD
jgi:predicted transcriptional regulator